MDVRPLRKILTDDTMDDGERFGEFVVSRAPGWDMDKAPEEEIVYLEAWAGAGEFESDLVS